MTGKEFYQLVGECPLDMDRDLGEVECSCSICWTERELEDNRRGRNHNKVEINN